VTNDEDADRAVNSLNGQNFGGRNLVVNEARPRQSEAAAVAGAAGMAADAAVVAAAVGVAATVAVAGAAAIAATVEIAGKKSSESL